MAVLASGTVDFVCKALKKHARSRNRTYRTLFAAVWALAALAGNLTGQPITVLGSNDPRADIPPVQAAVDQGGGVVLKGQFSFDAPPTITELPSLLFSGAAMGMILISKAVVISGALDDQGELTRIEGGINSFYVSAPGAHVAIQSLHFIHSKACAIRVVAAGGLAIGREPNWGISLLTNVGGAFDISTSSGNNPPNAGQGQPGSISGNLLIANNDIDMQGTTRNFLGIIIFSVGKSPDQEADVYISGNNIILVSALRFANHVSERFFVRPYPGEVSAGELPPGVPVEISFLDS